MACLSPTTIIASSSKLPSTFNGLRVPLLGRSLRKSFVCNASAELPLVGNETEAVFDLEFIKLQTKLHSSSRPYTRASGRITNHVASSFGLPFGSRRGIMNSRGGSTLLPAIESNQIAAGFTDKSSEDAKNALFDDQSLVIKPPSVSPPEAKTETLPSQKVSKRSSLTAIEKLRAARVLSRSDTKTPKRQMGSTVLAVLRESDGGKRRLGLPEAPTNMLDDSKRGMPKQGLTFDFPGGFDLFLIIFSTIFISTLMFGTAYVVWKVGAIHFNDQ